jgi:DNA mismatch endonuclease, patch repair protein
MPQTNSEFWELKLGRNVERDRQVDRALATEGWIVMRVWEHEEPDAAALRIAEAVRASGRSHATSARSPGRAAR